MAARNNFGRPGQRNHSSHYAYQHSRMQSAPLTRANLMQQQSRESPRPSSVGSTQSNHSSNYSGKGGKQKFDICVGEELRIGVEVALERFRMSEEQKILEFPSSLTSTERAYIHRMCPTLGLKSKSRGKGANRFLTVTKKDDSQSSQAVASFNLVRNSRHQIHSLVQRFPVTNKERIELQPRTERSQYTEGFSRDSNKTTVGKLNNGVAQVPPTKGASELSAFCETLPVSGYRQEIIKTINENRVVLISGETGSGKTTQVPQMILEDSQQNNKACRIICTQPRRISAVTVAERVASERGEKIGQTVGYQIRLESRTSPKTLLTYCTNGVLLRTLMGADNSVSTLTHVIVDEIHERDRFSDFLLIALRDMLPKFRHLKVVLMSASFNIQLFSDYFNGCPIISVPGKLFDVEEFFLEDILKLANYNSKQMQRCRKELENVSKQQKQLDAWCSKQLPAEEDKEQEEEEGETGEQAIDEKTENEADDKAVEMSGLEKEDLEPWVITEMDQLLTDAWLSGDEEKFHQIFHLILSENVSVDYMHSETSATPLMIAAGRGFFSMVEQLLSLGANTNIRASNDWSALDWAKKFERNDIIELLEAHIAATELARNDESLLVKDAQSLKPEDRELLNIYHHSFDDEKVDLDLIMQLLYKVHAIPQDGAVLIFLPGYDDIVGLRDRILEDKSFADTNRYMLYTLHSAMQSSDQKRVFRVAPPGVRKIILSTNIAETSVTINDVVFVIDSGKVKEKTFDALTSVSMLKTQWVSKASAIQRKGRAGRCRPGVCYHLFSRVRFQNMQAYQDPEILRYPLQELCLHTKLLAPTSCPIADFLAKAPEPPAFLVTRNAVHLLKQIDALDTFEDMTELGHHLVDLPVEPRYGKMLLYSVVLKCLDPVLTISCALAYRDPFILPAQPSQKRAANAIKKKFSADTHSDHMVLLRAFQAWQKARSDGWEKAFCHKNFISSATMEMIVGMRTQLLGQLRASGFVRARGGGDIRDLNTNSENWAVVKAALCAGMYPNIVRVHRNKGHLTTQKEDKVRFHQSSVLSSGPHVSTGNTHAKVVKKLPTDWLLYEEMTRSHRLAQVKCCTVLSPIAVAIFAGPAKLPYDAVKEAESAVRAQYGQGDMMQGESSNSEEEEEKDDIRKATLRLDHWLSFRVDAEAANLALMLRQKWHSLFIRRMRAPSKPWSQVDESVVRAVIGVLTNEEQSIGLQQPAGIGQRPRPMAADSMMSMGNRREPYDSEPSDDYSGGGNQGDNIKPVTPNRSRPFKITATSPRKTFGRPLRGTEDRSETSSVPSSGSGAGSANNSGTNSLRGSAASSPCNSPGPGSSPGKWADKDPGANSPHPCRFFVMKCGSHKNLEASWQKGTWVTSTINERKLNKAVRDGKTVYLVFSIQGSGHFQGYAKIVASGSSEKPREYIGPGLGSPISIEWVHRANLPFQQCHHLLNPWNENKRVQISRDGQEIEPNIGQDLIKLWDSLPQGQQRYNQKQGSRPSGQGDGSYHGQGYSPSQGYNQVHGNNAPKHAGRNYHGPEHMPTIPPQWSPGGKGKGQGPMSHAKNAPSSPQWSSGPPHGAYGHFSHQNASSGNMGYSSRSGAQTTPTTAMSMPQMTAQMTSAFSSLYSNQGISHSSAMSQGSGSNPFNVSQAQNPPVMILQRGQSSQGQGQSSGSNTMSSMSSQFSPASGFGDPGSGNLDQGQGH